MFKSRVVSDGGLSQRGGGVSIDVRLPWYRSLPLSTVSIANVTIDGRRIADEEMKFSLNGKSFSLDQLAESPSEWWEVLDSGRIDIPELKGRAGEEYEVAVTIGLRPPYLPGFYRLTETTKRLRLEANQQEAG